MKLPLIGKRTTGGDMSTEEIRAEAAKLKWYHCLELAPGYTTPGISGFALTMPNWETNYQFLPKRT